MSSVSTTAIEAAADRNKARAVMIARVRDFGIVGATVLLAIVLAVSTESFLSTRNLLNMLEQWAPVGIMAIGGTVILITGGFDLSVGGAFALSAVVTAQVAEGSGSVPAGVVAGVVCGTVLGVINGTLSTVGRMNVFVATIGTSIVYAGLASALTGGMIQTVSDRAFGFAFTDILGVNLAIWVFVIVIIVMTFVLTRTNFGRYVKAVGGKEEAARLAGVRVTQTRIVAFAIAGLLVGVAAVLVASRSLSVNAAGMNAIAFSVWTAMLLGGNSVRGGEGAVWRTVVGVILLALIGNGFDLLKIQPLYQQVVTGIILLGAISLDLWTRKLSR